MQTSLNNTRNSNNNNNNNNNSLQKAVAFGKVLQSETWSLCDKDRRWFKSSIREKNTYVKKNIIIIIIIILNYVALLTFRWPFILVNSYNKTN